MSNYKRLKWWQHDYFFRRFIKPCHCQNDCEENKKSFKKWLNNLPEDIITSYMETESRIADINIELCQNNRDK